jgi:signal peptidase II
MNSVDQPRSHIWVFWGVALLGLALDQWTKYGIFAHLANNGEGDRIELIPGAFRLVADYEIPKRKETGNNLMARLRTLSGEYIPRVNTGALFGMGRDGNALFALVSIAAAAAIVFWSTRPHTRGDRLLNLSLGLILAGTLGNFYDRIVFSGVRDFLHWYMPDWPVFNIADCCLVCGAGLLLVQAFFTQPVTEASAAEQEAVKDIVPQQAAVSTEVAEVK